MALDGGEDGLDFVREIARKAKVHLALGGLLEMEIGYDQGKEAQEILNNENYCGISIIRDLENCDRVVKAFN
ncbi:MAG: peptide chain release factor N(5)-glutamine methyltransferase, partial [Spirochaetales bacterium]|nr:peptide chain release factor N(5)-glutamine methyltransferase [Spirochaetales bacterium]